MKFHKLSKKIHPTEKDLRKADLWLEGRLDKLDPELKSALLMTGNELLENAVKFHMEKGLGSPVLLQITFSEKVELQVTNHFDSEDDIAPLLDIIDSINRGVDPRVQYMYRLKEIMEKRIPGESRLGLLRIAGEGNFSLEYLIQNRKLTVRASKYYSNRRADKMESLITEDFAIKVREDDPVNILWTGRSRNLNPSLILDKYLNGLLPHLLDREVLIDFTEMDSLNSSTIPPILSFLTDLEKRKVRTEVRYSKEVYWQNASFKPLSVLTREFKYVQILSA